MPKQGKGRKQAPLQEQVPHLPSFPPSLPPFGRVIGQVKWKAPCLITSYLSTLLLLLLLLLLVCPSGHRQLRPFSTLKASYTFPTPSLHLLF